MRPRRVMLCGALFAALLLQVTGATAAAPSNDSIGGTKAIGAIPYADALDTTEATTDADDTALNADCGAPSTDASVWYSLTVPSDTDLLADVSASDYSAGVLVGTGSPGSLTLVACGPGAVFFTATAGQTYYLLIIDDQFDGGGNGGAMQLSVDVPPPPPEVTLTVDKVGHFNRDGSATVSGTVVCSNADFVDIDGTVKQAVGRFAVLGYFFTELGCDGTTQTWSATAYSDNGTFKGGRASVAANAFACNFFDCGFESTYQQVRLRK